MSVLVIWQELTFKERNSHGARVTHDQTADALERMSM